MRYNMGHPSYLVHFNPNHDPKTGRFSEKMNKAYDDAYKLAIARAKTEDMTRWLTRGVPKGNKILVTPETKKEFGRLIKEMDTIWKEAENNWDDVIVSIITENGKDYVSVIIADKSLGDYYPEQLIELKEQ